MLKDSIDTLIAQLQRLRAELGDALQAPPVVEIECGAMQQDAPAAVQVSRAVDFAYAVKHTGNLNVLFKQAKGACRVLARAYQSETKTTVICRHADRVLLQRQGG